MVVTVYVVEVVGSVKLKDGPCPKWPRQATTGAHYALEEVTVPWATPLLKY
jgi:hypothetical protein